MSVILQISFIFFYFGSSLPKSGNMIYIILLRANEVHAHLKLYNILNIRSFRTIIGFINLIIKVKHCVRTGTNGAKSSY